MRESYSFKSKDEKGTEIHGVKWTPDDGNIRAVIQLNHGMIEYIERYDEFANFLCNHGFAVYGHDHIGHGESVSSPADWGIMHTDTPSDTMVEDMFSNYKIAKAAHPDLPYFILGHSMGSYLLRKFLSVKAKDLQGVNGAIIMGTGTVADGAINAGMFVVNMISKIKGRDHKSKMVEGLMFDSNYKKYDVTGKDPENSWLSKNVENVKKYYSDPKDTFAFSVNGYKVLLECTGYDNKPANIEKMNKDMPILFVSGTDDPVGAMGKGVEAAYRKFKDAGIKDVTIRLFENDRHEILNETDRDKVYEEILSWMESRM